MIAGTPDAVSHPPGSLTVMSSEPDTRWDERTVENLPTPGALREWPHAWVPTLDGEPIRSAHPYGFESRKQAWAEAILWVKRLAGLAMEVRLGVQTGCVVEPDAVVFVETVAAAREVILNHAVRSLNGKGAASDEREHLRLRGGEGGPTWEDLARCETYSVYDPNDPDAGMRCGYVLYEQGGLDGVGGLVWAFGVYVWATAPPEVWDHPGDQPCGRETDEEFDMG